jgi:hypothetical protein
MTSDEFEQHYHQMCFQLECHERQGIEFQTFFERIMQKHDDSFITVKPMGREGDWKCDGFSQNTGTVYQCYAPEKLTAKKAAKKARDDFEGAREKWQDTMKQWVFVWSSFKNLPPQTIKVIQDIRDENPDLVIQDWDLDALWKIVAKLPTRERVDLLGEIPTISQATEITAAEIQVLLDFLLEQNVVLIADTMEHIGLADKIQRNQLSKAVQYELQVSMPVARIVGDYVRKSPDSRYSLKVGSLLAEKYKSFATLADSPNEIFYKLVKYTEGQSDPTHTHWAAVGIITYYFQLCDIFER